MPHRHKIPADIEPADDISICVPLPNHPDYIAAFLFTLKQMTLDRYWQHTPDLAALTVRNVMLNRTLKPVLDQLAEGIWCGDSDDCIEYPPNNAIITYAPKDPFTGDGDSTGYLLPPFIRFADILPDFLLGFAESLTGYVANDVLTVLGSLPIGIDFDEILAALENGLPRFQVAVSGKGRVLLHLLLVPAGGRAIVSLDNEINPLELILGLVTDGYTAVELERDLSSIPPEDDIIHIEEIEIDDDGDHIVYVQFVPVLDDSLIPLNFGGGIRKVEWCGRDVTDVVIDCDYIQDCIETNPTTIALNNITLTTIEQTTETFLEELEATYDGTNPNSINDAIPTIAPDTTEKKALCYAIGAWVRLYCEAKKTKIRQSGSVAQAWDALQNAIVEAYGFLNNVIGFLLPDDLFSCFVSNDEALEVLSDESAIQEFICCLYDELRGIALLETSLEGAINACVASLTGNAQKVACVVDNDLNEQHTLNFFFLYGRALDAGIVDECACDDFGYDDTDFTAEGGFYTFPNGRDSNGALFTDNGAFKQSLAQYVAPANNQILYLEILIARAGGSGGINDSWAIRSNMNTDGVFPTGDTKFDQTALSNGEAWRCWRPSTGSAFRQFLAIARVQDNGAGSTIYIKRVKVTCLNIDTGMTVVHSYPEACP